MEKARKVDRHCCGSSGLVPLMQIRERARAERNGATERWEPAMEMTSERSNDGFTGRWRPGGEKPRKRLAKPSERRQIRSVDSGRYLRVPLPTNE